MQVIKLGGSVITDKSKYMKFRKSAVSRLAGEIARAKTPTVIVHGAGSFGHIKAKEHGLDSGFKDVGQLRGFAEVHRDVRELNVLVIRELFKAGVNAVSLPPSGFVNAEGGEIRDIYTKRFEEYLALGLSPVTFGDVVLDSEQGFCICSGDTLVYHIGKDLKAKRAVFVTDVDGIYGRKRGRDRVISTLGHIADIAKIEPAQTRAFQGRKKDAPGKTDIKDVTGRIRGKARVMLALGDCGVESILINGNKRGRLFAALNGERVLGTVVPARK
jgi:isopentenyl phosphate kinase